MSRARTDAPPIDKVQSDQMRMRRLACKLCDGVGYLTRFYLVTYDGKSWAAVRKAERITRGTCQSEYEASIEVRNGLAKAYESPHPPTVNQQVISAAKECECRR